MILPRHGFVEHVSVAITSSPCSLGEADSLNERVEGEVSSVNLKACKFAVVS